MVESVMKSGFVPPQRLTKNDTVVAKIPEGTTHFYLNVVDENQFLRSYPEVLDPKQPSKSKLKSYAQRALQPAYPTKNI